MGEIGYIGSWHIPYDLDERWDGGCRGGDLWSDHFGDEVLLLVSDAQSAYVCPEDARADWRLFIDACGEQTVLPGAPGTGGDPLSWNRRGRSFASILSCGMSAGAPSELEGITLPGTKCPERVPELPAYLDGFSMTLGGGPNPHGADARRDERLLAFDAGWIRLVGDTRLSAVDGSSLGRGWREWKEIHYDRDGDDALRPIEIVRSERYVLGREQMEADIAYLERERENCAGLACIMLDHALAVFRQSLGAFEEMERFEAECRKILKND